MTLAGIDVSAIGQGLFDWAAWRGRIQFAGIKISEGVTFADPDADRNIAGARDIAAVPMGYHFLHAGAGGKGQADYFMARCEAAAMERGDLMALDVEQGGMDGLAPVHLWAAAADFATVIRGHFGAWPVIYTDLSLASVAPAPVADCPLWLANPSRVPTTGGVGPWRVVSFEQTGQRGLDQDLFYGDPSQLAKLAIPEPAPAPAVPPKPTRAQALAACELLGRYLA